MVKRTLTLLEIMIVIFLITIITGAIGYNMKGALEKGKVFRTERAIEQLREIILLRLAEGEEMSRILNNLREVVELSGLAKDSEALLKDGWGTPLEIKASRKRDDVTITSKKLTAYNLKHEVKGRPSSAEEDDI